MKRPRNRGDLGSGVGTKGNGHSPFEKPSFLDNLFTQQTFPNISKELVHPGKDPGELLMRCVFKDERERNAAVLYFAKCEEFDLSVEKKVLLNWLSSTVSVRGLSRRELLMGATGIIAPSLYGDKQPGKRWGRKKSEETEQGEQ